ncbi:MAG: DUF5104 domain-containing protein [Firmicutes bacterium]|nr:DUF5104 domain-containing protein [[Eubacterium] siraeum]MCM1489021.1 DUF5104 domain-containing protein [Bacillota bacterium]
MKKLVTALGLILTLSVLTACHPEFVTETNPLGELSKAAEEKGEEIMDCIKSDDRETLKEMFCDELKNSEDFDQVLEKALDFIDGGIISCENVGGSGGRSSVREDIRPKFVDVKTDAGKSYTISISIYIKHTDPAKLGIRYFDIWLDGDEKGKEGIRTEENNFLIYTE